jgi:predicted DNA-binding transcriptional regulator YafY
MAKAQPTLTSEELQVIYSILKEHEENPDESEEGFGYDDDYSEIVSSEKVRSIIKKIGKSLPDEYKDKVDKEFLRKKYSTFNNDVDAKVYATLKKSLEQLRAVEIEYFSMESAGLRKRKVDVYYTSARYTIGYCHLRHAMRKFRTSRIASAKLTDSKYKIPKCFDKNDY